MAKIQKLTKLIEHKKKEKLEKHALNVSRLIEIENILEKVMDAIEQSKKFMLKGKHHLMSKLDK